VREKEGHALVALMVTDILAKASKLYVSGERPAVERAFGRHDGEDGVIDLPDVMSRKKQVAPKLLAALSG
jgi:manganese-dependent inorganic pyrophosphatase